ncbi:TPA: hypothetical protein ACN7Z1_004653 [Klebsiella pneumoniae]|uniref:hypothetical protein n=1 Tax=Klebsiella pneumoniae TaxID=573 RepID=UPI002243BAC4|nr:hypothetical protein [Klebsiella pneumoniae]
MLTHQIIQSEVEELKRILTERDLTIPSFWSCIWPGLACMLWFLLSSYFPYWLSDYASGIDKITVTVFAGAMGFFFIVVTAKARSYFLSLPESFRKQSKFVNFLLAKCKVYGGSILLMFTCLSFYCSFTYIDSIVFCVITFFYIIVTVLVMNIDLGRYQLATLMSVVESVRNKGVKLQ